jgi:hypothetical protein
MTMNSPCPSAPRDSCPVNPWRLAASSIASEKIGAGVHPDLAAHGVKDGAYYLGGGLLYRWELPRRWRLTLSSGPGYYDRQHSPRDLGSTLEFYSNVELARRLTGGCQIGLSFGHVSNGGFGNENPGSETLRLVFVRPIDRRRRQWR